MTDALRVLVVENSATDAKLVIRQLQGMGRSVEFERVETAEAMRAALEWLERIRQATQLNHGSQGGAATTVSVKCARQRQSRLRTLVRAERARHQFHRR